MLVQSRFDFTQLHSVSTFLDHSITSTKVEKIALIVLCNDVPGLIPAFAGGIDEKGICRPFWKVPIPLHDTRTRCNQFSSLALLNVLSLFIYNPDPVMRTSDSYWKRFRLVQRDCRGNLKIRTDVGLGWSV